MWHSYGPDEPTSELYRLMPPRRAADDPVTLISPDLPRWRKPSREGPPGFPAGGQVDLGIVGGVITGVLVALISAYLLSL